MAGKNTRKNKGPIGRKQHRTLRNKRQMRGGMLSLLKKKKPRVDDIVEALKKADKNIEVINQHLQIDSQKIDGWFHDGRIFAPKNGLTTIPTKINWLESDIDGLKADIDGLKADIKKLKNNIDPNNIQELPT
jgi:cobalamin-dependent methionine synthase I